MGIALVGASLVLVLVAPGTAGGQSCGRAVVVALPGVTWADVQRVRPPELLEAMRAGSSGSVSVRVFSANSDYGSGFATLGAGTRLGADPELEVLETVPHGRGRALSVKGVESLRAGARRAGYDATPGALASALPVPVAALGNSDLGGASGAFGDWVLLAAMTRTGAVAHPFTGAELLRRAPRAPFGVTTDRGRAERALAAALDLPCGLTIATEGDLVRAEQAALRGTVGGSRRAFDDAVRAADGLVGAIRERLDPRLDTLLIVSPTGPAASGVAHLGVAIAEGPAFDSGGSLVSASTRRRGTVTLPDVAPTVLEHYGDTTHPPMVGRPWFSVSVPNDLDAAVGLDREAVFVDAATSGVVRAFILFEVVLYGVAIALHVRRSGRETGPWLERAALAIVAFPLATYLAGAADGYELGFMGWAGLIAGLDLVLVAAVSFVARAPLSRLLLLNAATAGLVVADLVLGARLQMNTVLGYSPIVGGRFSGIGNLGFAVLAASAICAAALVVHALRGARSAVGAMAAFFAVVVVVDGAPGLGSDVGGTLALVPGLGLALVLFWGRRVDVKLIALFGIGALLAVAGFLAFDLARPPEARTHLARLYESVADRGGQPLWDAVERKAAANLRLLTRSVWALPVIPAGVALFYLVARPDGLWARLRRAYPSAVAGLVAGVVTAALGFAVNDSGIGIPSVMLIFLVPYALLLRLDHERIERS